ncbi:MAG: hypothetical protein ABIS86_19325 [Streptosporangiaceae bacterium]
MNRIITRRRTRPDAAAAVALAASAVTVVATFLPWAGVTVLVTFTVRGVDTDQGLITCVLAAVGALTALVAVIACDGRAMLATAAAGFTALGTELVFAFRLDEAFTEGAVGTDGPAGLAVGWFLAILGSLTMIGAGLYETFRRRRD